MKQQHGNNSRRNSSIIWRHQFVSIKKAITVLIVSLNNNFDDPNTRTKLTVTDIHKLTELCLSKSYFRYKNRIRLLEKTDPIVLSYMVALSECYLEHLERKAMTEALTIKIQSKTLKQYVDDSHYIKTPRKHFSRNFKQTRSSYAIQHRIWTRK